MATRGDEVGAAAAAADTGQDNAPQQKKGKYPCIRCKKNVTKTSKSVRCACCELWVHVECEQISPELFSILSNPERFGGNVMWNCDSCTSSVSRLHLIVAAVQNEIRDVKETVKENTGAIGGLDKRVGSLEADAASAADRVKKQVESAENTFLDEMEDRETRRLNLVFHGVGECPADAAGGAERIEWDKASCQNIFRELCLSTTAGDIKFCRRLGEKKEAARPLLVGFFTDGERGNVLRNAPRLAATKFSEVQVVPDLTKKQRDREAGLREEMQKRNATLSEEDAAKNLQWAVVGGRGERRLIKTTARQPPRALGGQEETRGGGRGRGASTRGTTSARGHPPTRGAARGAGHAGTAARGGTRSRVAAATQAGEEEEFPALIPTDAMRVRRGSKRGADTQEEEMELEGRPPEKR
jgi:hypothetical protein